MLSLNPRERAAKAIRVQRMMMYGFSMSAVGTVVGIVVEYVGGRSIARTALYVLSAAGFVSLAWQARKEAQRIASKAQESEPL